MGPTEVPLRLGAGSGEGVGYRFCCLLCSYPSQGFAFIPFFFFSSCGKMCIVLWASWYISVNFFSEWVNQSWFLLLTNKNPQLHTLSRVSFCLWRHFSKWSDSFPYLYYWNKCFPLPNLFHFLLVNTSWLGFPSPTLSILFCLLRMWKFFVFPQDLKLQKLFIQELFITVLFLNIHFSILKNN